VVPAVVAGPSCDGDDVLGGGEPVPVPTGLASGDPVWIHSAGAYATSYTTIGFNGFDPLPCETVRAERFRPIDGPDWLQISALESDTYGKEGLSETLESLRTRADPATSFVLDTGGRTDGYLLALPYPPMCFPDLTRPESRAFRSDNLFLHDIVIRAEFRGRGWGRRLVRHLIETAGSLAYERVSLVSVAGTASFWAACGFRPHPEVTLPGSYGSDAVYMSRALKG
jgi:ornithine decarboxylase